MATTKKKGKTTKANREASAKRDEAKQDTTTKLTQAQQLKKYKDMGKYEPYVRGESTSLDNGDEVAKLLRAASLETVVRAAEKLKELDSGTLAAKYGKLNPGSQRMNAGNIIRGFFRRGDKTEAQIRKVIQAANKEVMSA